MRTVLRFALVGISMLASATASYANNIATATGPFTPSFRSAPSTTYFGWGEGTWDGNPDPGADTLNGTPSINPGSGGTIVNNLTNDIVSGSNNVYTGPGANLTLTIPTSGSVGTGFTTVIVQGMSLVGFPGNPPTYLDVFTFGAINGVSPTYVLGVNDVERTQWWAKWELPGNSASYNVSVGSQLVYSGAVSVTDLTVDALWSPNGYAADFATAVPEPASLALAGLALAGVSVFRRRR